MNFIPTYAIYTVNSEYVAERKERHNLIIIKKTEGKDSKDPASAVLTAGGSGSGKSFFIKELFLSSTEENYVLIDSDNIKEELPEYIAEVEKQNLDAADIVHDESGYIANSLLEFCILNKLSFIYDGTMSNFTKYNLIVTNLKKHNFNISGLYVDIDVEIAIKRATKRAEDTGRAVPEKVIRDTNLNSAKSFYQLFSKFDEAILFNNTSDFKDIFNLEPFAHKDLSKLIALNHDEFKLFKQKVDFN